jgi:hypothetical protein
LRKRRKGFLELINAWTIFLGKPLFQVDPNISSSVDVDDVGGYFLGDRIEDP